MKLRRAILAGLALLLGATGAMAQSAPANLPYHTIYGRLGATPGDTGPGQAIPFATLAPYLLPFALPFQITANGAPNSVGIGYSIFNSATNAPDVVAIGNAAGQGCTTCNQAVYIGGGGPGQSQTNDTGNTYVGYNVGSLSHSALPAYNSGYGNGSLQSLTSGGSNSAFGRSSGRGATIDDHNTYFGHASGYYGNSNSRTTMVGDGAGGNPVDGTGVIPASPSGYPNVGALIYGFQSDADIECIGEACGKRTSDARKRAFAIGTYSRILKQDDSGWLGNGLTVAGTSGKWWSGGGRTTVNNNAGQTLTAAQVLSGAIWRTGSPGAGFTDTLPTAQQIIQSTSGGPGNSCDTGVYREFHYDNVATGQTATLQANGGTNPGGGVTLASVTGAFTVTNNTGTTWMMEITNCTLGAEAITISRTQ